MTFSADWRLLNRRKARYVSRVSADFLHARACVPAAVKKALLLQTHLSERNVVELVAKLKALGLLGDELLYTTNGKEYVTRERAAAEVRAAIQAAGGRIPLVRDWLV